MKELDEIKIVSLYTNNISVSKIADELNVDRTTIYNRLKKLDIYSGKRHRKYLINENYFESIDTQNKAYWLGFLMADGYNSGKYIRIDIKDEGHLDKFRNEVYINNDMPVRTKVNDSGLIYYLTIQDSKFVSDCEKHGIVKNKSFITKYPNIHSEYDRDFIRGLFDGDGCLTYSMRGNYRKYTFSIVGSKDLMNEVKKKLSKLEVNIGFRKTKTIYEIYISGNRQVIKVLDWLYFDNKTSMCRKEEKYKDLVYWDLNKSKKVKYE
jgi:intein-encoded DNA endonuclease-like protein